MRLPIALIVSLVAFCPAYARDYKVSPLYFGPNAMPVPEMPGDMPISRLRAELSFDFSNGFYGDVTETIMAELNLPLFSERVSLSLWMPVVEFYTNTPESLEWQHSEKQKIHGHEIGTVYIATNIHLLRQTHIRPDIIVRAAIVTASGDSEEYARYYDAPGYFFDATIAKSMEIGHGFFKSLQFAINGGFLCWQTGKSSQNDAYMYGIRIGLNTRLADVSTAWQGYTGWQRNGDRPMVFRVEAVFRVGRFRPSAAFEHGIRDYPFDRYRVGLGYVF
ncbi:MAG: hypothetical protein IAC29_07980 [Bacteroidetes bacterium]|uniref:Uncharacterized protein n=1 Tax=Candidatus Cryptobacteroides merdigallinarum TaxID=2840770 RepID=A0A9D9HGB6_9BACT|nr:hypothetical protein [Candidatus Cryptobacteroides merdigallinarum]